MREPRSQKKERHGRTRLQVDADAELLALLQAAKAHTGRTSIEVIRRAIQLYGWYLRAGKGAGTKLQIIDQDGTPGDVVQLLF